jgi:exodeoxyribonuclease VII small subunit
MVHCSFGAFRNVETAWSSAISPQPSSKAAVLEELSFEGALKELEAIVSRLEQGEVDLEDSIALYERGQTLKSHCEKKLKSAEGRLEKIVLGAGGPEIGQSLETA